MRANAVSRLLCRKFFTKAGDSKPAPQQAKLSFATKAADKPKNPVPKKEEESEGEDKLHDTKANPPSQRSPSDTSTKENSTPVSGERVHVLQLLNCG